jgi:hypothetical protein
MRTDSVNLSKMLWRLLRLKSLNRMEEFSKPRTFTKKVKVRKKLTGDSLEHVTSYRKYRQRSS